MVEHGWDMSDFLTRYTTRSNQQSSPIKPSGDLFNGSLESNISLPHENVFISPDAFCTQGNLEERLQYLNQELSALGFTPIFKQERSSEFRSKDFNENFDITKLVDCTYELLRRQHDQIKTKNDLESRQIRSENDNEYLIQNQVRLKQDLENVKREAALLLCREKDQIEKCRILQQDLKLERDEKRKMKADIDHLKKQFYHESKRTEKEITRLKEKVHQVLNDKSVERKIGIDILNSLQRADGKRSTWKTAGRKNEEDMYKMVISSYEEKEKGLLSENFAMRDLLSNLQSMLQCNDNSLSNNVHDEEVVKPSEIPFHIVKPDIEAKLKAMIASLKEKYEAKPFTKQDTTANVTEEDSFGFKQQQQQHSDDTINKLEHYEAIINGQEKMIQSMKDGYSIDAFEKILKSFGTDVEDGKVTAERETLLKEQERKFNEERAHFTEYVMKMSKEKEEFERERVQFYMHCLSTPVLKKDKKSLKALHHQNSGQMYPGKYQTVTPTFSPSPTTTSNQIKTPSTSDLYRFMSLNYDGGNGRNNDKFLSFDGSFVQYHDGLNSNGEFSPSSRKLQEHANNVRKAVEERHNKSIEEERRRSMEI